MNVSEEPRCDLPKPLTQVVCLEKAVGRLWKNCGKARDA